MDRARMIELLEQNSAVIREDLSLLGAGTLKLTVFGTDVTHDHFARLRTVLSRNEELLEACRDAEE